MTLTLLVLAAIAAANPFRAAAAAPRESRLPVALVGVAAVMGLILFSAFVSGPFLDAIDVTGPSARIGAGVALVAVCLKDLFARPPAPEPALAGWRSGLIPLAVPVMFSPALALLMIAGAADRGVVVAVGAALPAMGLAAVAVAWPPQRGLRVWLGAVAASGTAVGALVVLDGVYAI